MTAIGWVLYMTLFFYAVIYNLLAESLWYSMKKHDPGYFRETDTKENIGLKQSLIVMRIIFDRSLPKPQYDSGFKMRIKLTRLMLLSAPIVVAIVSVLAAVL